MEILIKRTAYRGQSQTSIHRKFPEGGGGLPKESRHRLGLCMAPDTRKSRAVFPTVRAPAQRQMLQVFQYQEIRGEEGQQTGPLQPGEFPETTEEAAPLPAQAAPQ